MSESALSTLSTLRPHFEEGSRRWPGLHHAIAFGFASSLFDGPPIDEFDDRTPIGESDGILLEPIVGPDGTVEPAVMASSRFSDASYDEAQNGIRRFKSLAATAWRATLYLPESKWGLLNDDSESPVAGITRRMWLALYRRSIEHRFVLVGVHEKAWLLWLLAIYNLAWQGSSASPLHTKRHVWADRQSVAFTQPQEIATTINSPWSRARGLPAKIKIPIERFYSRLPVDVFLASVLAIDALGAGSSPNEKQRPNWDDAQRVLTYRGTVIRTYAKQPALNQVAILRAFESASWPPSVRDVLSTGKGDSRKRLEDAVRALNDGLSPRLIDFRLDGTGRGVSWREHTDELPPEQD